MQRVILINLLVGKKEGGSVRVPVMTTDNFTGAIDRLNQLKLGERFDLNRFTGHGINRYFKVSIPAEKINLIPGLWEGTKGGYLELDKLDKIHVIELVPLPLIYTGKKLEDFE